MDASKVVKVQQKYMDDLYRHQSLMYRQLLKLDPGPPKGYPLPEHEDQCMMYIYVHIDYF